MFLENILIGALVPRTSKDITGLREKFTTPQSLCLHRGAFVCILPPLCKGRYRLHPPDSLHCVKGGGPLAVEGLSVGSCDLGIILIGALVPRTSKDVVGLREKFYNPSVALLTQGSLCLYSFSPYKRGLLTKKQSPPYFKVGLHINIT